MSDEPEFNDVDTLMNQDPDGLSQQDLDRIIAYQRKMRAQREAGVKTKKATERAPGSLNIDALLSGPANAPVIKRRF